MARSLLRLDWLGGVGWLAALRVHRRLVTARGSVASILRLPKGSDQRFFVTQSILLASEAILIGWVATDFSFDGVGAPFAKLGFIGRGCASPSALMLLGTAIVMAWQSTGRWRMAWQFAAMGVGVLFTASIGWARIDALCESPWLERQVTLMISTAMMATMTWLGLPRGLPSQSDWLRRGRQASPIFARNFTLLDAGDIDRNVLRYGLTSRQERPCRIGANALTCPGPRWTRKPDGGTHSVIRTLTRVRVWSVLSPLLP